MVNMTMQDGENRSGAAEARVPTTIQSEKAGRACKDRRTDQIIGGRSLLSRDQF